MSSAKWRPFGLGLNVLMAKIYLKTVVITFLETSKLVGLIMSGWNVTFWPTVNMQHCPARLQWDNLLGPYHGYAMREVSVNSTSLYETN